MPEPTRIAIKGMQKTFTTWNIFAYSLHTQLPTLGLIALMTVIPFTKYVKGE